MWDEADDALLNELTKEMGTNLSLLLKVREATKATIAGLAAEADAIYQVIGEAGLAKLVAAQKRAAETREAAKAAAAVLSTETAVPNMGSETWRQMLRYAREFAEQAYPALDPPQIATAATCVLCHQPLQEQARIRLAAFNEYIEGRANADAEQARSQFEEIARAILDLKIFDPQELEIKLVNFVEGSAARQSIAEKLVNFYQSCNERRALIVQRIKGVDYAGIEGLSDLDRAPVDALQSEIPGLDSEADQLRPTPEQAAKQAARQQEFLEYQARKKFSADIETFAARRSSLELQLKIRACLAACAVAGVTTQITRLRRKILTPSLQASLRDEIDAFDLQHLPLKLSDRGEVGKSKVSIGLEAPQRVSKNSEILSEGEKRALALAGFLAELKEVGARHGIIVDDPVSSLDHSRIEAVAKRLVREASAGRQVIIFTHNLFFHYAVLEAAREMKVAVREEWIAKHNHGRFGMIDDSNRPWISMGVSKRLAVMNDLLEQKKAVYSETDESNRSFVTDIYVRMRETWEHAIEEILFAGVIGRFRPNVATLRLRAARVEKADYEAVFSGMTRCSKFSGHDQSIGVPVDLPKFETIRARSRISTPPQDQLPLFGAADPEVD